MIRCAILLALISVIALTLILIRKIKEDKKRKAEIDRILDEIMKGN